jgi:3-hydroxyacyl-[acyl-carrier-protein] dehydratase
MMPLLTAREIDRLLPYRPPFRFLDAVWEFEPGARLVAGRCISIAEPCFAGHFPDFPVYPGVLLAESLAQTCALYSLLCRAGWRPGTALPESLPGDTVGVLGQVRMQFLKPVFPGCRLRLRADLARCEGSLSFFEVAASEDSGEGSTFAKGTLSVAEVTKASLAANPGRKGDP